MDIEKVKEEVREMFPGAEPTCSWMIFDSRGTIGYEQAHTEDEAWILAHNYCGECKKAKSQVLKKYPNAKCIFAEDEYFILSRKNVLGCGPTEHDAWYDAAKCS